MIVNADSMQLYRDLRILTARPSPEDEAGAEHRLYGVLDATETGSAGHWLTLVEPMLAEAQAAGRTIIVVGGTGLYLQALLHGLAPVPDVPAEVRARLRARSRERPAGRAAPPPCRPRSGDGPRSCAPATRSASCAPSRSSKPPAVRSPNGRPTHAAASNCLRHRRCMAMIPPPAVVAQRIEARLRAMAQEGALDEVRRLLGRNDVPADFPLLRATGVPELRAVLEGQASLDEALAEAAARTRQYAKRQRTYFRHRLPELQPFEALGTELDDPLSEPATTG